MLPAVSLEDGDYHAMPFEPCDSKLVRAACRSRTWYRKRMEYNRACHRRQLAGRTDTPCQPPPHGAWRSAARTQLARGFVQDGGDLPVMASSGAVGGSKAKQRQSRLRRPQQAFCVSAMCKNFADTRPAYAESVVTIKLLESSSATKEYEHCDALGDERGLMLEVLRLVEEESDRKRATLITSVHQTTPQPSGDNLAAQLQSLRSSDDDEETEGVRHGHALAENSCSAGVDVCEADVAHEEQLPPRRSRFNSAPAECGRILEEELEMVMTAAGSCDSDSSSSTAAAPVPARGRTDSCLEELKLMQPEVDPLKDLLEARATVMLSSRKAKAAEAYQEQEWELVEAPISSAAGVVSSPKNARTSSSPQCFNIGDDANTQCFNIGDDETPRGPSPCTRTLQTTTPRQSSWKFMSYLSSALR